MRRTILLLTVVVLAALIFAFPALADDDTAAPGPVTNFTATSPEGTRTISLSWTNPTDGDFSATRIMRTAAGRSCYPEGYNHPSDPNLTRVYEGPETSYTTGVMPFGSYCFVAFARDGSGNWSKAVKRNAVPDNTWAKATITSKPSPYTSDASAGFGFTSDMAGSPFQCRLDGSEFRACTSPKRYTGLAQGKHTFAVRALNKAGDPGAAATHSWTVDLTDPKGSVAINGGAASTRNRQVNLRLQAWDPAPASTGVSSMRFSNNGTNWSSWQSYKNDNGDNGTNRSWTLSSGTGTKTVYVQYRDRAGNIVLAKDSIRYSP